MKSFYIKAAHSNLRFHALPGDGVPLIFVHGLGSAGSCDFPQVAGDPALAGRPMLLVDLLGYGFSDRPDEFGYTVRDHAKTIAALVQSSRAEGNDLWAATLLNSSPRAVHCAAMSLIAGAWRDQLYQLFMPRTVLFGALSGLEDEARLLAPNGIATAFVQGAGHSMPWENPSDLARLIRQAIAPTP